MQEVQVVGVLKIALTAEGKLLILEAKLPSRSAALAMLSMATLDINEVLKKHEQEAAKNVIEVPPPGFNMDNIPDA